MNNLNMYATRPVQFELKIGSMIAIVLCGALALQSRPDAVVRQQPHVPEQPWLPMNLFVSADVIGTTTSIAYSSAFYRNIQVSEISLQPPVIVAQT